ncbi:hypothetical protein KM043_011280 [Ampulex compressa]|nr:hypothetical protein KM043_011280 [Ampulex compressa]
MADGYCMALDPQTEMYCSLRLYRNVKNADEIRKKLISGEVSCCVTKAELIVDPFQVVVAANKAALNAKFNQLTTKSLNTEVLFCLSISKNISRSLKEFGIGDEDNNILVILLHKDNNHESILQILKDTIKGEEVSMSELSECIHIEQAKRIYKIGNDELKLTPLIDSIVSRISCKDFISLK